MITGNTCVEEESFASRESVDKLCTKGRPRSGAGLAFADVTNV